MCVYSSTNCTYWESNGSGHKNGPNMDFKIRSKLDSYSLMAVLCIRGKKNFMVIEKLVLNCGIAEYTHHGMKNKWFKKWTAFFQQHMFGDSKKTYDNR